MSPSVPWSSPCGMLACDHFFTTPGLASHCSLGQTSTSNYTVVTSAITISVLIHFWDGWIQASAQTVCTGQLVPCPLCVNRSKSHPCALENKTVLATRAFPNLRRKMGELPQTEAQLCDEQRHRLNKRSYDISAPIYLTLYLTSHSTRASQ